MITATQVHNASILIVDDKLSNIDLLKKMLLSAGYTHLSSTINPYDVCELHHIYDYDLILLDISMVGMDGFQVMERLKEIEPSDYLPVLVITAQPAHKLRALEAGAKDFISKPFELAEVLARVRNMLEVRLLHKELQEHNDSLEKRVRDAEAQRWQAQKMDSLGALAGGMAHDINNLLVPVIGMTESVLDRLPPDSPLRERLNLVMDAGQRIKELVDRVLTFSRKQIVRFEPLNIAQVVHDAIPLVRASTPASMTIREHLDPTTGLVAADITQFHAVMMNLASNAAHALEGRPGHFDIFLDRVIADADLVRIATALVECRSYAHLRVVDDGCGMDTETQERMFDPFFTTREVGAGTGLGMAIIHGIISKHDGVITVHSTLGRGTSVDIYLPIFIPGSR